jgi:hypothetical protein
MTGDGPTKNLMLQFVEGIVSLSLTIDIQFMTDLKVHPLQEVLQFMTDIRVLYKKYSSS